MRWTQYAVGADAIVDTTSAWRLGMLFLAALASATVTEIAAFANQRALIGGSCIRQY